jgi:hypothetical protein
VMIADAEAEDAPPRCVDCGHPMERVERREDCWWCVDRRCPQFEVWRYPFLAVEAVPSRATTPEQEKIDALLAASLKPEEIAGPEREARARELVSWFARYTRGMANPKWVVSHACELAYYVATQDRASRSPAPAAAPTAERQQQQEQGWTKNDQPQEPEPSRDASVPLSDQDLAWMDEWAARCRTPYAAMSPDEARRVTAFAAMWFVPALNEVHRLRAAIRHYADQRKRYPRSGAEVHAFGKLLATVEGNPSGSGVPSSVVLAVDPSRSTPKKAVAVVPPTTEGGERA